MKPFPIFVILALWAGAVTSPAQWFRTTYALKGGWNAIFLHGDASYATPDTLFPDNGETAGVLEIWRWNATTDQAQFTSSPQLPAPGTPEWTVWKRGLPAQSNLSRITGQSAYLVKCSGTAATAFNVPLTQRAMAPSSTWVRSGANLLGFPTRSLTPDFPSFSSYFQSFPTATAANARIYKYVGGELGPANPVQIFANSLEPVDRNKAYWFEAAVVGNYSAPLDISLSHATGIEFGRTGSLITMRMRNTTSAIMTVKLAPVASIAAPAGQDPVTGQVPLTKRFFDTATATWTETPIDTADTVLISPNATAELSFGVNRAAMGTTSNALYAGLLRLTDSANLFDISLPVSARVGSLAGLWLGDATVSNVSSEVQTTAAAKAQLTDGVLTGIQIMSGGFGYGSVPELIVASPEGIRATADATLTDGTLTGIGITNPGSGYALEPEVTVAPPDAGTAASVRATVSNGIITGLAVTYGGTGYTSAPLVTIASPAADPVTAVAVPVIAGGGLISVSVTDPGAGYFSAPPVTVAPPAAGNPATAVSVVNNGRVTGITVLTPGNGYTAAPVITVGSPPARSAATAVAVVQNGKVTGYTITGGGSGYLAAPSITFPPPLPAGSATARRPPLRVILHVDDAGTASLLSQVFTGKLVDGSAGICTTEAGLSQADKATASRFVAAHLPLDRVLNSGAGSVGPGQTLVRTVTIPFDDNVNPFVHRYHPDHDNKNARGQPLGAGVESPNIKRTLKFEFTSAPPPGISSGGWGSTSIGGYYTEVIQGLHKKDLTVSGTFVLRRASEIGVLTVP